MQIRCAKGGGQQLALPQHFGLPIQRAGGGTRIGEQTVQGGQACAQHGIGIQPQLGSKGTVTVFQCGHTLRAIGRAIGNRGQRVGDARQRRHHHQHPRIVVLGAARSQFADIVPARAFRDRRPTKLEDKPAICGNGDRRHEIWWI